MNAGERPSAVASPLESSSASDTSVAGSMPAPRVNEEEEDVE